MDFEQQFSPENATFSIRRDANGQAVEHKQRDIYDSHRHRVFALAFYMTGNELEAERVLAQTFIDAFRAMREPDSRGVDQALLQQLRRRFAIGEPEAASRPSKDAYLGQRNLRRTDLEEAIQYLPSTERLVFLLTDVEGYSAEAIADLLNMPKSDVLRALLSARIRMRQVIAEAVQPDIAA